MSSSRQRYSSIPRDGPCKNFTRLGETVSLISSDLHSCIAETATSSLRCGVTAVTSLTSRSDPPHYFKTLPSRRAAERLQVVGKTGVQDQVDGTTSSSLHHQQQQYATRMSRYFSFLCVALIYAVIFRPESHSLL